MFGVLSFWTSKLKNWAITPTKSAFRACPDLLRCMRGQFCPHHTFCQKPFMFCRIVFLSYT